jgi:small multidrug resistance pump
MAVGVLHAVALLAGMVLNAAANIAIKQGAMAVKARFADADPPGLMGSVWACLWSPLSVGVLLFGAALACYSFALSRIELSIGYPVMTGGGVAIVAVASALLLHEHFPLLKIMGLVLITCGVALLFVRS